MASFSMKMRRDRKPAAWMAAALTIAAMATPILADQHAPQSPALAGLPLDEAPTSLSASSMDSSPDPEAMSGAERVNLPAQGALPDEVDSDIIAVGNASYYGARFAGRRTASGETFDPAELTAAHPSLPFGSKVRVTNRTNGRSVIVRINDRGPYHGNRVIDLSREAAKRIGIVGPGHGSVEVALLAS